ncbi:reverse transcriptase (RNA-dependent DNA polymerase) domain-containing protein [Phthorimaea operculella]|nr:reverse transcriptase (RNA-dependent DNA polymerase) domain-containing protein [Phthorimaea operculella]
MGAAMSCQAICNQFASTYSNEVDKIKHKCNISLISRDSYTIEQDKTMRIKTVTSQVVKKNIGSFNCNKSPGWDTIRMSDIKVLKEKISPVLAKFINLSVQQGKYPDSLKMSIVRPIYKGGKVDDPGNYRPISILSSINQITEKAIVGQVTDYLENNRIITSAQFGFQRGKGTDTLLAKFSNDINVSLNKRHHVLLLIIDFRKAFDTLDHSTLLSSLHSSGLSGNLLKWFENYLYNRKFVVKVNYTFSSPQNVKYGVAQGSVSGPMCYILNVNSMPNVIINCKCYMFADDTCIMSSDLGKIPLQQHFLVTLGKFCVFYDNIFFIIESVTTFLRFRSQENAFTTQFLHTGCFDVTFLKEAVFSTNKALKAAMIVCFVTISYHVLYEYRTTTGLYSCLAQPFRPVDIM